jgi:hypothetical protein
MRTPLAIKCREINLQKNPPSSQPCTAFCVRRNVGRRQHEQLPFDARAREKLALEKNVTDRNVRADIYQTKGLKSAPPLVCQLVISCFLPHV